MAEHALWMNRRLLMAGGLCALSAPSALAATPAGRRLSFAVFRNGARIGEHVMTFAGDAASPVVTTDVVMRVKLGPVTVYRYRHHAVERWAGAAFQSLETTTNANGKTKQVEAERGAGGVTIRTGGRSITAPAQAAPFTHWNAAALSRPLFNPQEGKMLKVSVSRGGREAVKLADGSSVQATKWSVRGEAEIDDWYDQAGVWTALRGKLEDGSTMEYRRG